MEIFICYSLIFICISIIISINLKVLFFSQQFLIKSVIFSYQLFQEIMIKSFITSPVGNK